LIIKETIQLFKLWHCFVFLFLLDLTNNADKTLAKFKYNYIYDTSSTSLQSISDIRLFSVD